MKAPDWTPFERVAAAETIAAGLTVLPACWSLTPLRDKRPYREGWQSEPLVPRASIADLILHGERCRSKGSGKAYTGYASGYGLRLGEASGGLVAIDIDGTSAEALLAAISGGVLPATIAWTSGKPGRRQLLYQVPEPVRQQISAFRRKALDRFGDLRAAEGELIEFRYNDHQSALPPSRHPETGAYCWLNSPAELNAADAPDWLCKLLQEFARGERGAAAAKAKATPVPAWGIAGGGASELEKILNEALSRLSARDVYKWPGHQFRDYGKTWRGYCPQHRSQSGTTFAVDPESREWYCFCCEVGGGPVQYRHFANGGRGRPRGAEFVAIVRELAAESGLSVPTQVGNSAALELAPNLEATAEDVKQSIWERSRQFGPTHQIDRPYFDWEIPAAGTMVAVRSALGTGKTSWLGRVVQQLPAEGWLALGHRNSLLLQSCRRWGFAHLHIDRAFASIGAPESRLALCVDSLSHFQEADFTDKNVILDEAMAIVRHLVVGGTLKQQRETILEKFRQALRRAKRIFCLDGMLADWCVDYLQQLAGSDRPLVKIDNQYRGEPLQIEFLNESFDERGNTKRNDRSPLLRQIWQSACPAICTDSQLEAEALDRLLAESGKRGLRIDSKTSDREAVRDFLQSPNYFLRQQQPQYLIYTPAAEAGVDISLQGYFSDQFCLFFGVLHTNAQQQMLGRIRDPQVPRRIWCRSTGLQEGESQRWLLPQQLAGAFEDFLLQEGNNHLEGRRSTPEDRESFEQLVQRLLSVSQDEHYQAFCTIHAIAKYERAHLRDCLRTALEEAGHHLETVSLEQAVEEREREKATKEAIKADNAREIYSASQAATAKPTRPSQSPQKTTPPAAASQKSQKQRDASAARLLQRQLPGIERSPRWTPEFIKRVQYDERQFLAKQECFWLLQHAEVARAILQDSSLLLGFEEAAGSGDVRARCARVAALAELEVPQLLVFDREWTATSVEVEAIFDRGQTREFKNALGLRAKVTHPIQYFRRLLALAGIELVGRRARRIDPASGESRPRMVYTLDSEAWHDPDRQAVLACLERRWQPLLAAIERACVDAVG